MMVYRKSVKRVVFVYVVFVSCDGKRRPKNTSQSDQERLVSSVLL